MLDAERSGEAEHGHDRDDEPASEIAGENDGPPRDAVDDRAADQESDQRGRAADRSREPELKSTTAEREDLERDGDEVEGVPQGRDGLACPQQPEIAMTKWFEDPRQFHSRLRIDGRSSAASVSTTVIAPATIKTNAGPWLWARKAAPIGAMGASNVPPK